MKKIITVVIGGLLVLPALLLAQQNPSQTIVTTKNVFPLMNWVSKDAGTPVTIQNNSGSAIVITINVNGVPTTNAGTTPATPGVNVLNCGSTTHIDAGSSAICQNNDPNNPVTLTSDNSQISATGTYQIQQK